MYIILFRLIVACIQICFLSLLILFIMYARIDINNKKSNKLQSYERGDMKGLCSFFTFWLFSKRLFVAYLISRFS